MSKQPPPAHTASAVGPCPTLIKIVGRPGTGSLPSTIAPPDHPIPVLKTCVNWAEQTQMPQKAASDQGLHCFLKGLSMQNTVKVKAFTKYPKTINGLIQEARIDQSTGQKRV